ncbi:TAXI family TRAP transporter solute-binding subunit [Pusillimonas sp.]|uniref:TAXI family TRAP transporter solute-binding subunit n=1 Tax=Pusillimonas sp. TaxID=3040095 RepID=UPI0029B17AFB|nr:TAXI family TRAP transporter solute-binding subunit [Pusillimonas sp.]MDX3895875.1 TAXI family TRAP transporter solute-binding subunit [Pusillimonas sp.]
MKRLFACLLFAMLAACGRGPDVDIVRADVSAQLVEALPGQEIEIVSLKRRGSQRDTDAPPGETRRLVYFDTELKLDRDVDFGAWSSSGISALVSVLGAGPRGISGVTSGGNRAGDLIQVHGTALYRQEGDQWTLVAPVGYRPALASGPASGLEEGPGALLAAIRSTLDASDTAPDQRRIIEDELLMTRQNIEARLARNAKGYAIAAGAEHGQYLRVARALFPPGSRTVPLVTRGSEENLQLLRAGTVSLALSQGDAAQDAYEGTGIFTRQGPHAALRSLGSLYPEPLHVLVAAGSGLTSIDQLRGKRVAIGEAGAASRTTALRVLQAHGLGLDDIEPLELSIGDAFAALRLGQADAVMQVIGTPADDIRGLLTSTPLRLLPLSGEAAARLVDDHDGYFEYTIARGTYPGQAGNISTVATAALLLTDTTLSDAEIDSLTRRVFESGRDYPGLGSAQASRISPATSAVGLSVPLHPAAARALEALAGRGDPTEEH